MKKLKFSTIRTLLLCVMLSFICESCNATGGKTKWVSYSPIVVDSTLSASYGDSIVKIIDKAAKIQVSQLEIKNDSLKYVGGGTLKKQDRNLLHFLVTDEEMVRKVPTNIFAKFCPMIRVDFNTKDNRMATLLFDFGLSQWSLRNAENKELAKGMTPNRQLLKFFHSVFPENETLNAIYNFKPEQQ